MDGIRGQSIRRAGDQGAEGGGSGEQGSWKPGSQEIVDPFGFAQEKSVIFDPWLRWGQVGDLEAALRTSLGFVI